MLTNLRVDIADLQVAQYSCHMKPLSTASIPHFRVVLYLTAACLNLQVASKLVLAVERLSFDKTTKVPIPIPYSKCRRSHEPHAEVHSVPVRFATFLTQAIRISVDSCGSARIGRNEFK